jgi:putative ABC transport system ATP-binding protein
MAATQNTNHQIPFQELLRQISLVARLERGILRMILSYAVAIGLFSLVVPLAVQELVSTFSYAVQPVMVYTLTAIVLSVLLFVGGFKTFHFYAVEMIQRRIFARVALGMVRQLPQLSYTGYKPRYANYFMESVFMQRALSTLLVDGVNVVVGGSVGMAVLVFYHPYFLLYDVLLMVGFVLTFTVLSRGALRTTVDMSHAKYEVFHWIQEISHNLLHLKSTDSQPWLMQKTDELVNKYMDTREARFAVLLRQFIGSVAGQALALSGALGFAGWLLSDGQLTLGQLVAVEAVVGALVLNFDSFIKSMAHVYYFFTALTELEFFFSRPQDQIPAQGTVTALTDSKTQGIRVVCKGVGLRHNGQALFDNFNLDIAPGEKIAIYAGTATAKTSLARVLAGLEFPTSGVVQYSGVDLRYLNIDAVNQARGLMIDSQQWLMEGTVEDNIVLGRPYVSYRDVQWALWFTELEEELGALPLGIKSNISALGEVLSPSHSLRILLARAIVSRPQLLIFDGLLHNMQPVLRETILSRLCAKGEPWTVVFVSNDPNLTTHVERRVGYVHEPATQYLKGIIEPPTRPVH